MNEENWFVIQDLDKFVESTRSIVFSGFGADSDDPEELMQMVSNLSEKDKEELNNTLTQSECLVIVKSFAKIQKNKRTGKTRYIINDDMLQEIVEAFNSRLVSNLLKQLVSKGLIESAYDEESNDFIFWVKDEDKNEKDKTN